MNTLTRFLTALTLVLSLVMLLLTLAGGVGVWMVRGPATAKATRVFGRIEAALDVAVNNLDQAKASLARAAERLDGAREEQRKLVQEPQRSGTVRRMLARTVRQTVAPELGDAHEKLHTVAEAAVVVNSVLDDLGNLPLLSVSGLDTDRLSEMNRRLADVAPAAWELSRLLGEPEQESNAGTQLSRIGRTVQSLQGLIAEYKPRLAAVRQQSQALQSKTLGWITPAAVVVSVVCFWIAISQVSLMCHAWSWLPSGWPL